jgi:hypothetical protein
MDPFEGANIARITIVSSQGVKSYHLGDRVNGKTIDKIALVSLDIGEETVHYYSGFATNHAQPVVFSVSVNCPHEIEYE